MASTQLPTTIENIPDDVLSNIFIRLLAKQVALMRCVSKSWNALLSESSYVKSHLHHSLHNNNNEILLFFQGGFLYNSITARPTHSPDLELTNFLKVPVNFRPKSGYGRVIGSVNGLICFSYRPSLPFFGYVIYIWNPSLSTVLTLPQTQTGNHFRFGYDPKTDDYKVLKLTAYFDVLPEVEVYSMRKGSWELITQRFPSHITEIRDSDKVCVDGHDGHLHWLGCFGLKYWRPQTIVACDLGAETFREIPLPDSVLHGKCLVVLGVLGGKLCVMSRVEGGKCEVWVMDEYGVAESWVKRHVFSQFGGTKIPCGFTLHKEFLYQDYDRFGLYGRTKTFNIMGVDKIVEYIDSLVWVGPARHGLSKRHPSVSIKKSNQLLKGHQKAKRRPHFYFLLLLLCTMLCLLISFVLSIFF